MSFKKRGPRDELRGKSTRKNGRRKNSRNSRNRKNSRNSRNSRNRKNSRNSRNSRTARGNRNANVKATSDDDEAKAFKMPPEHVFNKNHRNEWSNRNVNVKTTSDDDEVEALKTPLVQVFARLMTGYTITLSDVDLNGNVEAVKNKIKDKEGVPIANQRLLFAGKELLNDQILSNYDVVGESTLISVLRFEGGMKASSEINGRREALMNQVLQGNGTEHGNAIISHENDAHLADAYAINNNDDYNKITVSDSGGVETSKRSLVEREAPTIFLKTFQLAGIENLICDVEEDQYVMMLYQTSTVKGALMGYLDPCDGILSLPFESSNNSNVKNESQRAILEECYGEELENVYKIRKSFRQKATLQNLMVDKKSTIGCNCFVRYTTRHGNSSSYRRLNNRTNRWQKGRRMGIGSIILLNEKEADAFVEATNKDLCAIWQGTKGKFYKDNLNGICENSALSLNLNETYTVSALSSRRNKKWIRRQFEHSHANALETQMVLKVPIKYIKALKPEKDSEYVKIDAGKLSCFDWQCDMICQREKTEANAAEHLLKVLDKIDNKFGVSLNRLANRGMAKFNLKGLVESLGGLDIVNQYIFQYDDIFTIEFRLLLIERNEQIFFNRTSQYLLKLKHSQKLVKVIRNGTEVYGIRYCSDLFSFKPILDALYAKFTDLDERIVRGQHRESNLQYGLRMKMVGPTTFEVDEVRQRYPPQEQFAFVGDATDAAMVNETQVLMRAVEDNCYRSVYILLRRGHVRDATRLIQGNTVLHRAAFHGCQIPIIECLLDNVQNGMMMLNMRDRQGYTPLIQAAKYGHHHIVKILLERGADPSLSTEERMTALHWAEINGKINCANLIRRHLGIEDYNENCMFSQLDMHDQSPSSNVDQYHVDDEEEEDEFDEKYSQYYCDY